MCETLARLTVGSDQKSEAKLRGFVKNKNKQEE